VIAGTLLIVALATADQNGWLLVQRHDDVSAYHGKRFSITRVIDGDTIEIDAFDELNQRPVTRVRLWGVNSPELSLGDRPAESFAQEAARFARDSVRDGTVLIWLETHQTRDPFGAVLAHVELHNGQKLNELLLEHGLARADDRWPHASLVRFEQLQNAARRNGLGMWGQNELADKSTKD
jgi:endonuclease YncB( thermonuclease family)